MARRLRNYFGNFLLLPTSNTILMYNLYSAYFPCSYILKNVEHTLIIYNLVFIGRYLYFVSIEEKLNKCYFA